MSEPIIFVDSSTVREGKLEDLKTAMKDLAGFVEAEEPRPILYHMFLSGDETDMTVVQVHPDSSSMEHHMRVAAPVFRQFVDLVVMTSMHVFGHPSEDLLDQMRQKARMLGLETVQVHEPQAGFARLGRS